MTDFSLTHRHIKSGKDYKLLGLGMIQSHRPLTDMAQVAVYQGQAGDLWAREAVEFAERFTVLPPPEVPIGIEFLSNTNVGPGVAVAVHEGRVLYLGPAADMPNDPRVALWPVGVIVNLHPQTYRKMAELANKQARKIQI